MKMLTRGEMVVGLDPHSPQTKVLRKGQILFALVGVGDDFLNMKSGKDSSGRQEKHGFAFFKKPSLIIHVFNITSGRVKRYFSRETALASIGYIANCKPSLALSLKGVN